MDSSGRATMVAAALLLIIYAASSMKIPPAKIPPVRSRIKPGKHGYLLNNEHHLSSGERYDAEAAYAHERKLADDEMRLPCAKFTDVTSCTQTRVGCGWCVSTSSVRLLLSAARGLDRLIDTPLSLLSSLTLFSTHSALLAWRTDHTKGGAATGHGTTRMSRSKSRRLIASCTAESCDASSSKAFTSQHVIVAYTHLDTHTYPLSHYHF